jgi:hypothetical protein
LSEGKIPIKFSAIKIPDRPVKTVVDQLATEINAKTKRSSKRLQVFMEKYEKQFKQELAHKRLSFDITETEVLRMMKGPLTFYALNMNGQVLIDLAGLLERYAIIFIEQLFKSMRSVQLFPEAAQAFEQIMEKKRMDDLARHLIVLGLWDEGDEERVDKVYQKRNYIAHKNIKSIELMLSSNKSVSVPEIDLALSKFDVLPFIFITIRLLLKLLDRFLLKTERMRVAKALLECRILEEHEYFKEPRNSGSS